MSRDQHIEHAVALTDHFLSTILEAAPELLVSSLEDLSGTEIRQVAWRLSEFRAALIEELVSQPHIEDSEDDYEDEEDD